jgi:hypothetical protein
MKAKQQTSIHKTLKRAKWLFATGLVLVVLAPFIFTREFLWDKLDFHETGQIGDTIGGITSPIVNLIGAVLVYFALKAQIEANMIIQRQLDEQKDKDQLAQESKDISQLYTHLKESIDNFSYSTLEPDKFGEHTSLAGSEAIYKLFQDFYCDYHGSEKDMNCNPKITEIVGILEICDGILKRIRNSSIPDRDVIKTLTLHQFEYRVMPRINMDIDNLKKYHCESCKAEHGLPDRIVKLIDAIAANSR